MKSLIPLLILSQFLILPNLSFRWGKEIAVQILIIVSICSLIWKKNKPIALFVLWSLFLLFLFKGFSVNDVAQGTSYTVSLPAFFNIINIVLYGLFYYVLHQLKIDKEKIFNTFCFIGIIQAGYVILQWFDFDQFFFRISGSSRGRIRLSWPVGLWGNEALVSWCLAMCSPFFLAFKKLRYKIGYALSGLAILCTGATAGLLAYIAGFIFWLFFKKPRIIAVSLIVLVLLGGIISYRNGKFNEYLNPRHRLAVWKKVVLVTKEATIPIIVDGKQMWGKRKGFITGHGLGSFRQLFALNAPEFRHHGHWAQAHNDYLQILFEQGIIGLGIILSLMWITFYRFLKRRVGLVPITCLFVTAIVAFFGFPFRTAMGIIPIVALVLFEKSINEK